MKKIINNATYDILDDSTIVESYKDSIKIKHDGKEVVITKDDIKKLKKFNDVEESCVYSYINKVLSENRMTTSINCSEQFIVSIRKAVLFLLRTVSNDIYKERKSRNKELKAIFDSSKSISDVIKELEDLMDNYGDLKVFYEYEEDDMCGCCSSDYLTESYFRIEDVYLSEGSEVKAILIQKDSDSLVKIRNSE